MTVPVFVEQTNGQFCASLVDDLFGVEIDPVAEAFLVEEELEVIGDEMPAVDDPFGALDPAEDDPFAEDEPAEDDPFAEPAEPDAGGADPFAKSEGSFLEEVEARQVIRRSGRPFPGEIDPLAELDLAE